jgi:two-component sensor histidine kinase
MLQESAAKSHLRPHRLDRVALSGPEIELAAASARNLSVVFHELTTDAVKYGALKDRRERVNIGSAGDRARDVTL